MRKTKKPIRVTRSGKPVAEVVPASPSPKADWIGSMKDTIEILGDVVLPANEENEWEALRD
jgi:prevent-host-death family protein